MTRRCLPVLLALVVVLSGCGSRDDDGDAGETGTTTTAVTTAAPTTTGATTTTEAATEAVTYTDGSATVEITGGDESAASLELSLDPDGDNALDPEEGDLDIVWVDPDGNSLEVSVTNTGVEEGTLDAFVRVEVGGPDNPYVDSLHDKCEVEVTALDDTSIEGEFTCQGLAGFGEDNTDQTVDAEGTFTATA